MDKNSKNDDSNNRDRDMYLNHLNKLSHKISKPLRRSSSSSSSSTVDLPPIQSQPSNNNNSHHQPPVYNINKNDFRDVVQRLTGSPVLDRFSTPPPTVQHSKPTSSRLQKIRPPPLPQITTNRCPNMLTVSQRQPFSPLPPFPTVHATAESPISAYMKFYQNSVNFNFAPLPPSVSAPAVIQPRIVPPTSPLPFGCLSPGVGSHGLNFSPTGNSGFPQLPLSPTLPVSSPRQKGH